MHVTIDIPVGETTQEGFAPVAIQNDDGSRLCQLDVQYSKLSVFRRPNPHAVDFLLLAAVVYALDKLVRRDTAVDCWTRQFAFELPVSDSVLWNGAAPEVNRCLSFLTGDLWDVRFVQENATLIRPVPRKRRRRRRFIPPPGGDAVCLFSGGLDSLIGTMDWLELHQTGSLLLVGHHDGQMAGPYADQRGILTGLQPAYPNRTQAVLVRVGHADETTEQTEITLRSRSLVFVALGMFVASAIGPDIPLFIPENGTIALNVPLTPSRRGSCSTRTAHPHYLGMLKGLLAAVGLANPFSNPLETRTKGEAIAQCHNRQLLNTLARVSVSCAKRGHKAHWTHRDAGSCGRCMPCIYRRAALHVVGWDDERYGDDICLGEVSLDDNSEKPNDLRACLSFLRRNPSVADISAMLMASGSLDPQNLASHAAMVRRTMDEIRSLLRNKATTEVKRLAGV